MSVKNLITIIIVIILVSGCKKDDQSRLQASWSAMDPIAIPFNNRSNEKSLGNVAPNPSFESGKIYYQENGIKSFDLNGWKTVGANIEWLEDSDNEVGSNEVYDGIHSVKITREIADETENTGTGIISDFIKVIPGNYSLKLFLKLENVIPNQMRIGTKMYDAVNIRLKYFDKNRLEIDGTELNAFSKVKIDNGFKAYSLSNYWDIKELGWGEIYGKTANYPFFDGDLPDDVRYVKIFIGLKGTGTMWVDKVDFRFTNSNFTLLERLKPYFDSSYNAQDMVYPKPKQSVKKEDIVWYNSEKNTYPLIVVPNNGNINAVAKDLKEILENRISKENSNQSLDNIKIVNSINANNIIEGQFIISIGNTNLYRQSGLSVSNSVIESSPQAYSILQSDSLKNIIFINANDNEGYKNSLLTFEQLLSTNDFIYHSADIIDYPDFLNRSVVINEESHKKTDIKEKLALFNLYKINNTYFELNENIKLPDYINYSLKINLSDYINEKILDKGLISKSLRSVLIFDDRTELKEISQVNYNHVIKEIRKKLTNKNVEIELLPYWNNLAKINTGHGEAEYFFREFDHSQSNISIFWTGSSKYSYKTDYADLIRIKEIEGKIPVLFDNNLTKENARFNSDYTKEYYAGKLRLLSFIEPYNPEYFGDFHQINHIKKIVLNTPKISVMEAIRVLTAANYFWNTTEYNPEWSLWVVLNKLVGRENAINIIYFNDAYFGLKEICKKMELNGVQHKNQRIAKNFESSLNKYFLKLREQLDNISLLKELESMKTDLIKEYNSILKSEE